MNAREVWRDYARDSITVQHILEPVSPLVHTDNAPHEVIVTQASDAPEESLPSGLSTAHEDSPARCCSEATWSSLLFSERCARTLSRMEAVRRADSPELATQALQAPHTEAPHTAPLSPGSPHNPHRAQHMYY